ncbi:MAG TPA: 2,3,4,5-tetrahydropyridine-2,6-dicarboxylate N-succinyltransferase, partial [Chitinophagaceae bacterium]|nr:2,3,4,5-tetrahydropyridine-2,6-dicarboxylate N-succinyltransferase [Chitinophagaceae bacterium]
MKLKESIEQAWQNREMLTYKAFQDDIRSVIEEVDKGRLRVAEPAENGWVVNEWVKQAILLYFG